MRRSDIYNKLEEKMLSYTDYADVPLCPTDEECIAIPKSGNVIGRQIDDRMRPYTGDTVLVRWSVLQKLREAAKLLSETCQNSQLEVVYGYRAPEVQRKLFEQHKARLRKQQLNDEDLIAATHRAIALPEVAGHPTGGAVDVQIAVDGRPVDMGTRIWEFVSDSFTFSPFISKTAWHNRQLLRRVMMAVGFAPFDGEWWHFSYGDKEWARFYGERASIYESMMLSDCAAWAQDGNE